MINIVFADNVALSLISLPLLVYHPTQMILGGVLTPFLQEWVGVQRGGAAGPPSPTRRLTEGRMMQLP